MAKKKPINPARRKRLEQRFNVALRQHQAGELAAAEKGYRQLIETDPEHGYGLHYLGLILRQRGQEDEAIDLLFRASHTPQADATLMNNLGCMLCDAKRRQESIPVFSRGVALEPENRDARLNLAGQLLDFGHAQDSLEHFQVALSIEPENLTALGGLGRALLLSGEAAAAVVALRKALQYSESDPQAYIFLTKALLANDQFSEAFDVATRAVALAPDEIKTLMCLGTVQMTLERYDLAEKTFRKILERKPNDPLAYGELIHALVDAHREEEALVVCAEALKVIPDFVTGHINMGNALKQLGRLDEAIDAYRKAIAIDSKCDAAYNNMGMIYMDLGDMQAARQCFEKALEISPYLPEPLFNLSRMKKSTSVDMEIIERLEKIIADGGLDLSERVAAHFALGKAYDDDKNYPQAFEYYQRANDLKRRTVKFAPDKFMDWVRYFSTTFSAEFFQRCEGFGVDSERPVFIVGMPRSGTTLVEQIMSSHPQVYGGDELTYMSEISDELPARLGGDKYPQAAANLTAPVVREIAERYLSQLAALDDCAVRVTDKMPSNFYHLGLIAVMFPRAHIIHCQRDPMDACFSNFIQLFGTGHFYSYSLDDIAVYYRAYRDLMAHWRQVLPMTIHEVRYEDMVDDQERISRGIIDALGLEWDENCLAFHKNQRAVRTASNWQVRQPIYKTARQRWKNYAPYLEKLRLDIGYQEMAQGVS